MRNIRRVRDFIEAKRHVLTHSAKRSGENKKQKDEAQTRQLVLAETALS